MSNLMRELFFADAFYIKDIENSNDFNEKIVKNILQWKHDDPEGVNISNVLGWQSRSTMQKDKVHYMDLLKTINQFLHEVWSAEQYNKDYDSGLLGQGPGNLDIGQTRVFTKPFDIYDFITNNRQAIADNDFVINSLPINSSATNIFINSNDCVVDLNPENNEFLTIQNQAGLREQGVLVGDFALTVQNGSVKRQATMQIALRDKAKDKQAF